MRNPVKVSVMSKNPSLNNLPPSQPPSKSPFKDDGDMKLFSGSDDSSRAFKDDGDMRLFSGSDLAGAFEENSGQQLFKDFE